MRELYSLVTAAVELPVSVDDCKSDLRIDGSTEDSLIESYIQAASKLCSEIVGRKLINETWKLSLKTASATIDLPFNPCSSITEIQYYDSDNNAQTLSTSDFNLYSYDDISQIETVSGFSWPQLYNRRDALNITFVTGYGAAASDIPDTIKRAIRLTVAHWYEHREGVVMGVTASEIPYGIHLLLNVERVGWVG